MPPLDDSDAGEANHRLGTLLKDKYRLDAVLGVGGMAIVYAATHRNQKRFAVKILRTELSIRADIRARFLREGYIANTVGHPGAVAVMDDDVASDGGAFLVMELLEGAALEALWERHGRTIPLRAALAVGWQLLDVLASAHAKAIVHRDIKPANLFVTREGALKVLDFGIARLRDAASEHATQSGTSMGTPAFMPPEQVLGKSSEIDGLTDVWAVGATLFTLVSGQLVHEGETPQELMVKSATTKARSIASVSRELPPSVVTLIDRALSFEKASRWPSAIEMREAIASAYLATFGEAVSAAPLTSLLVARGAAATIFGDLPSAASSPPPNMQSGASRAPPPDPAVASVPPTMDDVAYAKTVAGAVDAPRIGMTTSQPVSTELAGARSDTAPVQPRPGPTTEPPSRRRGVMIVAASTAALALASVVVIAVNRAGAHDVPPPPASAGSTGVLASAPASTHSPPTPSTVPAMPEPVPTTSVASVAPPGRPVATIKTGASARPSGGPPAAAVSSVPPAASPPPAASTRPKPNCDPPYTIDDKGHQILKRECL